MCGNASSPQPSPPKEERENGFGDSCGRHSSANVFMKRVSLVLNVLLAGTVAALLVARSNRGSAPYAGEADAGLETARKASTIRFRSDAGALAVSRARFGSPFKAVA